jgi:hypothetical protein
MGYVGDQELLRLDWFTLTRQGRSRTRPGAPRPCFYIGASWPDSQFSGDWDVLAPTALGRLGRVMGSAQVWPGPSGSGLVGGA